MAVTKTLTKQWNSKNSEERQVICQVLTPVSPAGVAAMPPWSPKKDLQGRWSLTALHCSASNLTKREMAYKWWLIRRVDSFIQLSGRLKSFFDTLLTFPQRAVKPPETISVSPMFTGVLASRAEKTHECWHLVIILNKNNHIYTAYLLFLYVFLHLFTTEI